ncbi:MAG: PEP-CTERM sorting domain-containing protein [Nitrosomonas sp.]|uniref:PEP-CTERM sorting domain-containing protein n=1 Tax=Nitrosomonas sp. TaxID=42353 RepID=UPI0027333132|nr:PEP-CTERM sorting domain-containing protein [Nitrosomonas sp.]MDP3664828.1 PEP-CTERM sorting domain-containing protein [Nitrosomonas sp.]MDZ4105297.1 PEP-CTERM sorting domain-containing protein [Nitrosomonas sp.]
MEKVVYFSYTQPITRILIVKRLLFKARCVATLTTIAGALAFPALAQAASFNELDVNLVGSATIVNPTNNLLLTPSVASVVGAAWLSTPVSTTSAFSTTFSFNLSNAGGMGNADGLALVFHNSGTSALGTGGGSLGIDLPDNTTPGGSVAAVLRTFWSTYGIVQNTDAKADSFTNSQDLAAPIDLSTATLITGIETVTYNPFTHDISQVINLNYTDASSASGSFSRTANATFDLSLLFGESMIVGLSAATGAGYADQAITSWTLAPVPEPEICAMLMAGLGLMGAVARRKKNRQA